MKRNIATAVMLLLLCVLLCACGYRDRNSGTAPSVTQAPLDDLTDMTPDAEDGMIDDDAAENGVVDEDSDRIGDRTKDDNILDENYTTPIPRESMKP